MQSGTQKVTVRPAKREDCSQLLELIKELAVYEKAPDEVTVSLAHFVESGFGSQPVWWAQVACVPADAGEQIVGFALYYIRYSTWKGQRMYLEDIIVTEAWRGKGIGSLLMERLMEVAKEQGFSGINWQVLDWNEPAIKFYQRYEPRFDGAWVNVALDL